MAVVIELPHVGESVVEGVIGKWLAHPGDQLRRFDPLVEVVTDKVTMEVPSPYDGVLISVLAQEGETVPMGAPIAEMDTGDGIQPRAASRPIYPTGCPSCSARLGDTPQHHRLPVARPAARGPDGRCHVRVGGTPSRYRAGRVARA